MELQVAIGSLLDRFPMARDRCAADMTWLPQPVRDLHHPVSVQVRASDRRAKARDTLHTMLRARISE